LGIVTGVDHVADDREITPAAPGARLGKRRTKRAGRV
jgi:hypothetical protein